MTDYVWHNDDYDKRIKLTIDGTKIDEDMTDFPVLIHLSDSSGITSVDVTSVFDEITPASGVVVLSDTFSGTSLNASKWGTYIAPNASVTVSDELQLNNSTGSNQSGANCYSKDTFTKESVYILTCKWKPHKNHYASAHVPHIKFCKPDAARDSSYGCRNEQFVSIRLGDQYDTTDRTKLFIADAGTGAGSQQGTERANESIDIDETQWHDLEIILDCDDLLCTVDLDSGTYNFSANIDSTNWDSIGASFVVEFSNIDYNKTNTERFKDVFLSGASTDYKKMAIYTTSGVEDVQCYTEVERWASYNEEAWVWTKIPTLYSGTDAVLYLYYDKDASDNTTYIGDTGDYAAKQVWDSNFLAVYHMAQDPNGDAANAIKDSTSNGYHATPHGSMTSDDLVGGKIGKAIDFDGSNDYLEIDSGMVLTNTCTVQAIHSENSQAKTHAMVFEQRSNSTVGGRFASLRYNTWGIYTTGASYDTGGNVSHIVGTKNNANGEVFLNGVSQDTYGSFNTTVPNRDALIGARRTDAGGISTDAYFDGIIEEVRLSSIVRSDAWIVTDYNSCFDSLITFGSEEPKPSFVFNGYVQVLGSPAAREVYLYHRSTGELVGSTTSSLSTGYFEIPTPFNDYHFVNILPELDEDYNIIVQDKIKYGS